MANPQIEFKNHKEYIEVMVPLTSQGKFRCKIRDDFKEFGKGFAPKTNIIPANAYVEWQIGYDAIANDDSKDTSLTHMTFIGANGKTKHPYELSEILYNLCIINIISKEEITEMINTIENMTTFLQDMYSIEAEFENIISINDEDFFKSVITLPTFNKKNESCDIITQISIEKQQYATGVQPMLYVNIPMNEFENSNRIIGNTSENEKYGVLKIDKSKKDVIKNIFLCFGMCSYSHHHDIIEILKLIENNI